MTPRTDARNRDAGSVTGLEGVRADFPILARQVHGQPLVYLDNAASTQKPLAVIDAIDRFYREENANIHRGVHALSELATDRYEGARGIAQRFLGARSSREIVFVRGTTEGINLVARSWGDVNVSSGDEVLITELEHHSNIVPWQLLCQRRGATLRVLPIADDGTLCLEQLDDYLTERTRIVAVSHLSNALGTVNPVAEITRRAHQRGVPVLVDGAQSAPRMPVDVAELDCDFFVFSGHKIYGPTGIGVLYAKEEHLDRMAPYEGGGEMIRTVTFEKTTYNDIPWRFEAGTPNIAGAVGLGAALDYLAGLGLAEIARHEAALVEHAERRLGQLDRIQFYGTGPERAGLISFNLTGIHPHDLGTVLDRGGVAVRAGHHCAQPVMQHFGVLATVRASFGAYSTIDEIDVLVAGLEEARELFG